MTAHLTQHDVKDDGKSGGQINYTLKDGSRQHMTQSALNQMAPGFIEGAVKAAKDAGSK